MTELLTFGVTFLLRAMVTTIHNHQEIRKQELSLMRRANELTAEATHQIREQSKGWTLFGITSSILAIMGFFTIIVLPKIVPIFWPNVDVFMAYKELSKGFLFFTSDAMQLKFTAIHGMIITPLDTHLASAIAGLYFGSFKTTLKS